MVREQVVRLLRGKRSENVGKSYLSVYTVLIPYLAGVIIFIDDWLV